MEKIYDNVLGELVFNRGWVKKEIITLWDKKIQVDIIVSAYKDEKVNEKQRDAYKWVKENISKISIDVVRNYINIIKDDIIPYIDDKQIPTDLYSIMKPVSIILLETGSIGVLCNCVWDLEHGIGILINEKREIVIGPEEIIWE